MQGLRLFAVGVLFAGCGGPGRSGSDGGASDAGTPVDGGGNNGTLVTLSGARSEMLTGMAPSSDYTPSVTAGNVSGNGSSATDQASFTFGFPAAPATTTYVGDNDAGITCNVIDTVNNSLDGWMANRGGGLPDLGSCSLTLTSVSLLSSTGSGQTYAVHGSVSATLAPRGGAASGTIDLSASF